MRFSRSPAERQPIQSARSIARSLAAGGLGVAATLASFQLGLPGGGEFIVIAWLAGFVGGVVAPGAAGWGALTVGIAAATGGLWLVDLATSGLFVLVVAVLVGLSSHGWLAGWTVLRVARLGGRALRDGVTQAAIGLVVAGLVAGAWLAGEMGRNPP